MLEKLKANILFHQLLKRPDISKAYKMVGPEDSWYDTITKVHESLIRIQKLPREELTIASHDGLKLKGYYYPNNSKTTVIWVHGYTSHAERESAFPGLFYLSLGCNVLVPYMRAHGPSEGNYISLGALEHRDMMLWAEKVNEIHPDGKIVFHGLSMGGGIVLDLACKEMKNVVCLVSDAPSVSVDGIFENVARSVFKKEHAMVYAHACSRFLNEFHVPMASFDRVSNITSAKYPLLLTAGSEEHMEDVLNTISKHCPTESQVLILPGCNHGNGMYKQTQMYQTAIKDFLAKYGAIDL